MNYLEEKLKSYFGFDSFRERQKEIIQDALRDIDQFIILPTGSGKSICFQLPALLLWEQNNGISIVITPLKSLIEDQIYNLTEKNINVRSFYGETSYLDKFKILNTMIDNPEYSMIYTTPETIDKNSDFFGNLKELHNRGLLNKFIIDESHCISTYGNDFRKSYRRLSILKQEFPNTPIMSISGSITPTIKSDVISQLNIPGCSVYTTSYYRSNLKISIRSKNKNTIEEISQLIKNRYNEQCGIIYCISRKKCEKVANYLALTGLQAKEYHAGLKDKDRKTIQNMWKNNIINVICCTTAFGMGIDKPDVRYVIHYNIPTSIENYYQEIGRAGRDGLNSDCVLYYSYSDKIIAEKLINQTNMKYTSQSYIKHQKNKLDQIVNYAENLLDCRHCQISNYFGEYRKYEVDSCGHSCDNCINRDSKELLDITDIAKSIFNLIMKYDKYSSKTLIRNKFMDSEEGSQFKKTNGTVKKSLELYDRIFTHLIVNRYIKENLEKIPEGFWCEKYQLYSKCKSILNNQDKIIIPIDRYQTIDKIDSNTIAFAVEKPEKPKKQSKIKIVQPVDPEEEEIKQTTVYKKLDEFRKMLAVDKEIPCYCILKNQLLLSLASLKPKNGNELKAIKGVGNSIFNNYGAQILHIISEYL